MVYYQNIGWHGLAEGVVMDGITYTHAHPANAVRACHPPYQCKTTNHVAHPTMIYFVGVARERPLRP